jgi:hypothetical protein
MQTKITDKAFYKSASNLTRQDLQAQVYEAIHLLGSLLNCVDNLILSDKCKNKIKNYKNYPQAKLWIGYVKELLFYIDNHLLEWFSRGYKTEINGKNLNILISILFGNRETYNCFRLGCVTPSWITDELIQTHRSVLIQKEIEREKKDIDKIKPQSIDWFNKNYRHYRNLWPNCPIDLKMHYNWRGR